MNDATAKLALLQAHADVEAAVDALAAILAAKDEVQRLRTWIAAEGKEWGPIVLRAALRIALGI